MGQGEVALVDVTARVWANAPQRAAQVIDRLMALRLVSGAAIVSWVFACPGVRTLTDELSTGLAWEVFYNAVNKMLARTQVCTSTAGHLGSIHFQNRLIARRPAIEALNTGCRQNL